MQKFLKIVCGILICYVLIYLILSSSGSYQVVDSDLNHASFGWIPCGFYPPKHQNPNWLNKILFLTFLPLWDLDEKFIHKNPPPTIYFKHPEN
jgi:hypothetical protein